MRRPNILEVFCSIGSWVLVAALPAGAQEAVVLFGLGMHIEPLGRTAQGYGGNGMGDYWDSAFFDRHVADIQEVAAIVERHGGRMTVQAQSPFTQVAVQENSAVLRQLAQAGHEIALHFHEDAHLGRNSSALSPEEWCQVMREEIDLIKEASGVSNVSYWSGGNLYPGVYEAAACAGLWVQSDWKNPATQATPAALHVLHPWRPAGGTDGVDFSEFLRHDPQGPVIFLPEGLYDVEVLKPRGSTDDDFLQVVARGLQNSLAHAAADKVNVFHFTVHPGELRQNGPQPFAKLDQFLTQYVDPLVAQGRLRWATFTEMARAYQAWEQAQESPEVRKPRRRFTPWRGSTSKLGYFTFAINVHDWTHPEESAATISRLVDLFQRYGVAGDFYFTAEIARELALGYPEVVAKLKQAGMTVSYHVRPPHPLYEGFNQPLQVQSEGELYARVRDYETYALDLTTGELDRSRSGGYRLVSEIFGTKPVVASAATGDAGIRSVAQKVYRDLGAQMTVLYHESGTKPETPFEYVNGLLVRPSDFSVTRVTPVDGSNNFWWNFMGGPQAASYHPLRLLELGLASWQASNPVRTPFVTSLIHENNFVRRGPEGWTSIYYEMINGRPGNPLPPPWDLHAPDPSSLRPSEEQEAIWRAYEELVAYVATHFEVVTSKEIVDMARQARGTFDVRKTGTTEYDIVYCSPGGEAQKLDLYYPSSTHPWPAVVYVHGGGWTSGSKGDLLPEVEALREAGFLVASINYRLAPQHQFPAMIEDVKCAVRFLRAHAPLLGLDASRIGAIGGSAGGHLVGLLGTTDSASGFDTGEWLDQSSRVQAVADMWGPADLTVPFAGNLVGAGQVFGGFDAALASPVTYVTPEDPPFLLVHGAQDPLVPASQSERFYYVLRQANVPADLLLVENAGHSLVPTGGTPNPSRQEVISRVVAFFCQVLFAPCAP